MIQQYQTSRYHSDHLSLLVAGQKIDQDAQNSQIHESQIARRQLPLETVRPQRSNNRNKVQRAIDARSTNSTWSDCNWPNSGKVPLRSFSGRILAQSPVMVSPFSLWLSGLSLQGSQSEQLPNRRRKRSCKVVAREVSIVSI